MPTDLTDFERLVLRMRAAKDLERQVDLALTGRTMTAQQPSLFDPR